MSSRQIIVVGGGAAGFFAAIAAAEQGASVRLLEKSGRFLEKVRISGGGRCNVTHACFEIPALAAHYPRGRRALLGPLQKFSAADTVAWFAARGVTLKTEPDGRMFPVTDSSATIVDCLMAAADRAGVKLHLNSPVETIRRSENSPNIEAPHLPASGHPLLHSEWRRGTGRGGALVHGDEKFEITLAGPTGQRSAANEAPQVLTADRVLLATGGCRAAAAGQLAVALGHQLEPPVPSLFTFQIETPWLRSLAGVSLAAAEVAIPGAGLRERGPLLVTHWGLSGPAILKMSAWGARVLHELDYRFKLLVNWVPESSPEKLTEEFQSRRQSVGARLVVNVPLAPLTARLWEQLVLAAGLPRETRWAALTRPQMHALGQQLTRSEFLVTGKSLNKDEFVTCGGVKLSEVNFQTLESRVCPGLFFAGELLDIDGVTGGFNFQAAWTTGFIAGHAMAG